MVEIILDKGIVIDAYARVSLVGIELLTLDARIVIASVDTYLRFAEATNRLDLSERGAKSPVDILTESAEGVVEKVADSVVEHKVEGALDKVGDVLGEPAENVALAAGKKAVEVADKAVDTAERRAAD
ncbi:MAG TPA: gas vesicle protein GvpJ [Nocardioides sp.]|nr:gas vesicle protein GvpJ [Nocardioides sp.]